MSGRLDRHRVALALQAAALAAAVASLLGVVWLDPNQRPRVALLVDRSDSMPRAATDQAVAGVLHAAQAQGQVVGPRFEFAGRAAPADAAAPPARLQPFATDIGSALLAVLAHAARDPVDAIVVVSDGHATQGDTPRALDAVRAAGVPLHWLALGRPPPPVQLAEVLAPAQAREGQRIELAVQLAGATGQPWRVRATARGAGGVSQVETALTDAGGRATLGLDAGRAGAVVVDLALEDPRDGQVLLRRPDAAAVDVVPRGTILYVQGSAAPLATALQRGGWTLDRVPATQLDSRADALAGYQAVVLDDVAVADAGPRLWQALATAVRERGLGLLVLGGERAFARGGYRGSVLESVLPLKSEPAALDPPTSVLFAVDKSGSMGAGSGGVDRFVQARRAVVETAQGFGDRDAMGLLVFDVEPRLLLPVAPAPGVKAALQRDWPVTPNGGTRLQPALDAALDELQRGTAARRLLVLVTDGFVDEAPLEGWRRRLERAGVDVVALAVGADADAAALQRLLGERGGLVLRVDEAAELPAAMRSGVERRRARVERGRIVVRQRQPLPFAPAPQADWPEVAAHAVTRPQPQATVVLESQGGEPLLATHQAGRGRVAALTTGLGPWAPLWLGWSQWPQLAGGLADWVAGSAGGPLQGATVTDLAASLVLAADTGGGAGERGAAPWSVTVDTPTASGVALAPEVVAPGRWRVETADAGPGLYTFVSTDGAGTRRLLHLRRAQAEHEAFGTHPALADWRRQGLVRDGAPAADLPRRARAGSGPDRSLIVLALVLGLAGIVADRSGGLRLAAGMATRRRGRTGDA